MLASMTAPVNIASPPKAIYKFPIGIISLPVVISTA